MIKLFWNTHNQQKPNSQNITAKRKQEQDYGWGSYHKKNSDKWIYEILKKIQYTVINKAEELKKEDILIIIDSSIEEKNELYLKFKERCSKIFLFHLGDETGIYNHTAIYNNCDYVWRAFCLSRYFQDNKIKCIPIGYKSGISNKQNSKRKYRWAFTGTPHKSSRHDLLFQLSNIKPFYCHKTKKFDEKIISVNDMNEVLSSTEFIPCPNGFFHPETYRIYEALECDCIPIVEDAYGYYDRLFPKNPFIKINKWLDAKSIIESWNEDQILKKREECKIWWSSTKNNIQDSIKNKIIK